MASRGTWIVLAVVAAIAVAAAADALRGDGTPETSATGEEPAPTTTAPAEDGEAAGDAPEGVLYFTDAACRLRAVRLPDLERVEPPGWSECGFVLSPDGRRVSGPGSGWDARSDPRIGRLFQSGDGTISVATNLGPDGDPVRGRTAAWRPDGTLAYVDVGAVRAWPRGDVLLAADDVLAAIRSHPAVPDGERVRAVRFEEIAWLAGGRLAAILRANGGTSARESMVAVFDAGHLVAVNFGGARLSDLRASPGGRFFAVRTASDVLVFDRRGGTVPIPALERPTAVAFAPDERRIALATASGVHVVTLGGEAPTAVRLPLVARDLAWRGLPGTGALDGAAAARPRLEGLGATGRLLVTEAPGCRLRALRLPDLEWEAEPGNAEAPCRFDLAPGGDVVPEGAAVRAEDGVRAECRDGELEISSPRRADGYTIPNACAPAWAPDGRLTFARNGELVAGLRSDDERVLISRDDLERMFGEPAGIAEVAWFDDARLWASVRVAGRFALAAMTTSGLQHLPDFRADRIGRLVTSSGMVAAVTDEGVVILDGGGRRTLTFPDARAVAWAPGELVAAVAMRDQVLFVSPVTRDVVPVPLVVEDLEWAER